jgi:hypothetical protein
MKTNFVLTSTLIILFAFTVTVPNVIAADHWEEVAAMYRPRLDHTSTLLPNGKVLVAGGDLPEVELYDPEERTFQTTGSLPDYNFRGGTATLLQNGKVLLAGGMGSQRAALLYDPDTGIFTPTDSLAAPHTFHTATLLSDGRVLIAGGQNQDELQTHAVCEIYDPEDDTFSLADSLNQDRSLHTATLLQNGQVLIAGGIYTTTPGNGNYTNTCEIYDPVNDEFSMVQNMISPRSNHEATLLADGSVLVSGGSWSSRYCERYDVSENNWTQTGDMVAIRRNSHTATLLNNGKVLVAGGYTDAVSSSAELYDPGTNSFTAVDSMFTAREQHAATLLPDGNVLVTGGYSSTAPTNLAELFVVDEASFVDEKNKQPGVLNFFQLFQNYPNPFNPATTIAYSLKHSGFVVLTVYDVLGREIETLVNEFQIADNYRVNFTAKNLSAGIYVYQLQIGNKYRETKKMVYIP